MVEGDEIPYLPAALEKRNANRADWMKLDPEIKCYMPGIPRATYMPYPFQIVQSKDNVLFTYEFTSASRVVRMNSQEKSPGAGVDGMVDRQVGRRITRRSKSPITCRTPGSIAPATITATRSRSPSATRRSTPTRCNYEATIEDPNVFSKPWTIKMPLYRRREPNMQLIEYKCVPFAEELMYGHLRKKP